MFELFRRSLVVLGLTYSAIRFVGLLHRWHVSAATSAKSQRLLVRYVEVSVLKLRLERFWFDLVQVAVLAALLWWVVSIQL